MARMRGWVAIGVAMGLLVVGFPVRSVEAPSLMLATRWDMGADPAGWWMSEKYDGVRGYWDGERMLTRQGNRITIPPSLRAALPDFPLDGELWAGRGQFEETLATVRDAEPGRGWDAIGYMIFDAPARPEPFEARVAFVERWLAEHPSAWLVPVAQIQCTGTPHLRAYLERLERQGAEGVMLRASGSPYVTGRSGELRKYKSFDDSEATVRGYNPGRGKYAGMVGSLRVELPNGVRFSVGSGLSDHERREPPPLGSVITFRHNGWTAAGKPRFPVFWRLRELPVEHPVSPDQLSK